MRLTFGTILSFFFLFLENIEEVLSISVHNTCKGCSSFSTCDVTYVKNEVYGCGGTWSQPGINSAADLCEDGYEICDNYNNFKNLGLTYNLCTNLGLNNYFYVSKQELNNKLYGCTNYQNDLCINIQNNNNLNNDYGAFLSVENYDAWEYGWYLWDGIIKNQTKDVTNYVRHIYSDISKGGDIMGGVLCCRNKNFISPQNNTNDTSEPTTTDFITTLETTSDHISTLSPTNIKITPTPKPSSSPINGLTSNKCCHAYRTDRYELRCNFLDTKNLCSDLTVARRCYWKNDDCTSTNSSTTTFAGSTCYCTGPGERKRYSCSQVTDHANCKFQNCDWQCS